PLLPAGVEGETRRVPRTAAQSLSPQPFASYPGGLQETLLPSHPCQAAVRSDTSRPGLSLGETRGSSCQRIISDQDSSGGSSMSLACPQQPNFGIYCNRLCAHVSFPPS